MIHLLCLILWLFADVLALPQIFSNSDLRYDLRARQEDGATATAPEFLRRGYHASVVAGDWLYTDGGEFSYQTGGNITYEYCSYRPPISPP